jgi:hypothetical protein
MKITGYALLAALLCACSFAADDSPVAEVAEIVEIALPAYPSSGGNMAGGGQNLPRLAGWLVVTLESGAAQERFVSAASRAVRLELPKNRIAPVLCYPLVAAAGAESNRLIRFFYPAGCIYPVSFSADWKHGFDAELAFSLLASGALDSRGNDARAGLVSGFNWKRLHTEIDTIARPWNMNMTQFKVAVTARAFAKYIIKEQKTVDVYIEGAPDVLYGRYVPDAASSPVTGAAYAYCASRENLVFDGRDVFLVYKQEGAGGSAGAYRLALMPLSRYIYTRDE